MKVAFRRLKCHNHLMMNKLAHIIPRISLAAVLAVTGLSGAAPVLAQDVRMPKVAGQFYPDDPLELKDLLYELFDRQSAPVSAQKPRILISPHAGYQYSGLVAASGYRQLEGHRYDGVVVVGFTHRQQFAGASVDTREVYQTPLGEIPVDREGVAILMAHPGLHHLESAHEANEHSLEVQLPFLQAVLGQFKLIPVLMGDQDGQSAAQLADALATLASLGDYLFVFSTDLSHYHSYDEAEAKDEATVHAILHETARATDRLFKAGQVEACGRGPIVASLYLAERLGYPPRTLIFRANSGDTAGNPSNVVGYAALAMYDPPAPKAAAGRVGAEAGAALVRAARQSLERAVSKTRKKIDVPLEKFPELNRAAGVFVTLRRNGELRGCIGRIETGAPLRVSVVELAVEAATRDHRFSPVTAEEVPSLHVEVSVLTPRTPIAGPAELIPGRDGVVLEHQGQGGVFLPTVWQETGWTRLEFLRELASQKAGLPPDAWKNARLFVFQDQVFEE